MGITVQVLCFEWNFHQSALTCFISNFVVPSCTGPSCISAIGTIEGKFDCGYLVSVKLGSEVLRGVLYHPEQPDSSTSVPESNSAIIPYTHKPPHHSGHRRRRRKSKRRGDPNYPKPNRSGYNFFFAEKHYKLKSLYPNREREFTKMIGESWTNLSPEERMVISKTQYKPLLGCCFSVEFFISCLVE
jgi:hypothetical protein